MNKSQGQFIAFGGIYYDFADLDYLKLVVCPVMEKFRKYMNVKEIKSNALWRSNEKTRITRGGILTLVNAIPQVKTIYMLVDKLNAEKIKSYDKISFKYNFVLWCIVENLIKREEIESNEEIKILIDNQKFSDSEKRNIESYLVRNFKNVSVVRIGDSIDFDFLQIADVIAGLGKAACEKPTPIRKNHLFSLIDIDYLDVFPRSSRSSIL